MCAVIAQQTPGAWDNTIYLDWLACWRELSSPTSDLKYPEASNS